MREGRYRSAVEEFTEKVRTRLGGRVREVILYGSAASGRYREGESDIDLLVTAETREPYEEVLDIQTDVNVKYGVALSVLFDTLQEIQREVDAGSPFMREVLRKGVRLYESGGRGTTAGS
jgi:predicted nucleotidyltransferase